MTVDDKLNWEAQFRSVKGKIASGLASLKKLKNIISQSQLMEVYYALEESHLRYANVVWGSLSDTKIEALQRLQNRAFDIIDSSRLKGLWERRSLNVNQVMNFDQTNETETKVIPTGTKEQQTRTIDSFFPRNIHSPKLYLNRAIHFLYLYHIFIGWCYVKKVLGLLLRTKSFEYCFI